jgi:hypothetical protein
MPKSKIQEVNRVNKNYTRQRQGRDFSLLSEINHLQSAEMSVEAGYSAIDGIIGNAPPKDDSDKKKALLEQLEYHKAQTERNAIPTDGEEPAPQERPARERTR